MRPVRRGVSPKAGDYSDYTDAKTELISRIASGQFKKRHIEPKDGVYGQPPLKGRWTNFLLACVNCNSTKGDKQVLFDQLFFPDRDNTFYAFEYLADGSIIPARYLNPQNVIIADNTLSLVGLDNKLRQTYDADGNFIAQERAGQHMEVWGTAESALENYLTSSSSVIKNLIINNMLSSGFFSVWMTVFKEHEEMKSLFIEAINGTQESACFDPLTGASITPHPNADQLLQGSKI